MQPSTFWSALNHPTISMASRLQLQQVVAGTFLAIVTDKGPKDICPTYMGFGLTDGEAASSKCPIPVSTARF